MNPGYSTQQVSELLGMSEPRIRHYVRTGLVDPERGTRREYRFSFRDIVVLRTAKGLVDSSVSLRKANRALRKLKFAMQGGDSGLARLRILADGNHVVVRTSTADWNAETGQGHLDFAQLARHAAVAPIAPDKFEVLDGEELTSDDWYNLALDLEDVSPREAPEAYRRSIELDPGNADAWVNLGRLMQLAGRMADAEQYYRHAVDIDPDHELATYNLGTIHDERDEWQEALSCYHRAVSVADAHYNLARLYEMQGNEIAAMRHMRRYQELAR